jgi:hypothetical protein
MRGTLRAAVVIAIATGAWPAGRTGTPLVGMVTDVNGRPLSRVTVFVHRAGEGTLDAAETDGAGRYDVNLSPGKYSVDFDAAGFDVRRVNGVVIPESGLAAPVSASLTESVKCECTVAEADGTTPVLVSGRIADDQNRPVPNAMLELTGAASYRARALSGRNGDFAVRLPIGHRVTLTVTDGCFEKTTRDFTAKPGRNAAIEIRLRPTGAKPPATESIRRGCRCPDDVFTHPDR